MTGVYLLINNYPFFCSWSGGKDSCLALYRAIKEEGIPSYIFNMLTEDGERSRSHGLSREIIEKQAESLKIPVIFGSASWKNYEEKFTLILSDLKKNNINHGIFGDIDLDKHHEWVERVCSSQDITAYLPLWKEKRENLVRELLNLGFKAILISVKEDVVDNKYLGNILDWNMVREFKDTGIDVSGEGGEYHTLVIDGPLFSFPLQIKPKTEQFRDGYWSLDVELK